MKNMKRQITTAIKAIKEIERIDAEVDCSDKDIELLEIKEEKYANIVRKAMHEAGFKSDDDSHDVQRYLADQGIVTEYNWIFGDGSWC